MGTPRRIVRNLNCLLQSPVNHKLKHLEPFEVVFPSLPTDRNWSNGKPVSPYTSGCKQKEAWSHFTKKKEESFTFGGCNVRSLLWFRSSYFHPSPLGVRLIQMHCLGPSRPCKNLRSALAWRLSRRESWDSTRQSERTWDLVGTREGSSWSYQAENDGIHTHGCGISWPGS